LKDIAGVNIDIRTGRGVAVCIPTYNEASSIREIFNRTRATLSDALIVIIDDNSPDGTGDIADELARNDANALVIHNSGKAGLGAAYRVGFRTTIAKHPEIEVLISMDADGSHDPADLPRLLQYLDAADVVLGSRWVSGGKVVNWPKWREALSRGGNSYARAMLGFDLGDATGGFRAYRKAVLEAIEFDSTTSEGYCFQVEMVGRSLARNYRVFEMPITFTERTNGVSKMSNSIVIEAFGRIGTWGLSRVIKGNPFLTDKGDYVN
jgi:dolichol-phosphate mannosyltransferase